MQDMNPSVIDPRFIHLFMKSPALVALEKADRLKEITRGFEVKIDTNEWTIKHRTDGKKTVFLMLRPFERIWAHCNAYLMLWDEHKGRDFSQDYIDFSSLPNLKKAFDLLDWAMKSEAQAMVDGTLDYPSWGERPDYDAPKGSYNDCANELMARSAAFILLHEIAHCVLEHTPTRDSAQSIKQEREADAWAIDWILDGPDGEHSSPFIAKAIGCVSALLVMVAEEIDQGYSSTSHPAPHERLYWALERKVSSDNHPAWWFAAYVLDLHIQHSPLEIELESISYEALESPKALVSYFIAQLAHRPRD